MKRRLLTTAVSTSLLLFLTAMSMWARSYRGGGEWTFARRNIETPPAAAGFSFGGVPPKWYRCPELISANGSVQWFESDDLEIRGSFTGIYVPLPKPGYTPKARLSPVSAVWFGSPVPGARHWSIPGIDYVAVPTTRIRGGLLSGRTSLVIRWWLVASLFALLPLGFATRLWKQRRSAKRRLANLCLSCGYDLRASTDRCPECGTPIEAKPICRDAST